MLRSVTPRVVAMILVAAIALLCVGDLADATMAAADGHDCFGSACQDQISCGQPAPPRISSAFTGHLLALPAAVEAIPALEKSGPWAAGPPLVRAAWQSVLPLAARSPPAA